MLIQHERSSSQHLLSILSENVDIEMQVCDRHVNEHTALKQLGRGKSTGQKKGWRCSLDRISKVYLDQHQKMQLELKFHLYVILIIKILKRLSQGVLKLQKFYVNFTRSTMDPFLSGVHPHPH